MARAADNDKLTPSNIEKVIRLLAAEKPITKKAACEILGINYNTSRLADIIAKHKERIESWNRKYQEKKGTKVTENEMAFIIEGYLKGESLESLSKQLYRSTHIIGSCLDKANVPRRVVGCNYYNPLSIPEDAIKESFEVGEKVYSARYTSLATIRGVKEQKEGNVYLIWLEAENWLQFAYQPWWELASLEHLKQFGVNLK